MTNVGLPQVIGSLEIPARIQKMLPWKLAGVFRRRMLALTLDESLQILFRLPRCWFATACTRTPRRPHSSWQKTGSAPLPFQCRVKSCTGPHLLLGLMEVVLDGKDSRKGILTRKVLACMAFGIRDRPGFCQAPALNFFFRPSACSFWQPPTARPLATSTRAKAKEVERAPAQRSSAVAAYSGTHVSCHVQANWSTV